MFSSVSVLYPLDASSTLPSSHVNSKCPLREGVQNCPWLRTSALGVRLGRVRRLTLTKNLLLTWMELDRRPADVFSDSLDRKHLQLCGSYTLSQLLSLVVVMEKQPQMIPRQMGVAMFL